MNDDPVADVLAVECPECGTLPATACSYQPSDGDQEEEVFCASRIRAALAMPRGEAREAEYLAPDGAAVDPRAVKLAAHFDQVAADYRDAHAVGPTSEAIFAGKMQAFGEAASVVRTMFKLDTRTAERSEGVKESDPGTPRACETCGGSKRIRQGAVPCPRCTGG